jgi:dTDP-4-amino-4,6-dideoxygalactose transaminase
MTGSTSQNTFYFYRGRVALYALLRALNAEPHDEVILQAFTCLAVPSPIVALGLRPIYVDIDPKTYNLDPRQMEQRVTPRTRVIIVQHTFGIPAPMDAIVALARNRGLVVIEDCCHTLGSTYGGKRLGCIGDAAFYSYEWGKPIVIGLGGAAVVHSEKLLHNMRALYDTFVDPPLNDVVRVNLQYIAHAMFRRPTFFWTIREIYRRLSKIGIIIGTFPDEEFSGKASDEYQRKMAPSLRARLAGKLAEMEAGILHRKRVGTQYENGFTQLGLVRPKSPRGGETVYLQYPLIVQDKRRVLREARKWNVELGDLFASPVHPLTSQQWKSVGYEKGCCPIAEDTCGRIVSLPLHESVRQADIDRTLDFLRTIQQRSLI